MVAVLRARGRIGRDAAGVVVRDHDDQARSGDDQVESDRLPRLAQGVVEFGKKIHGFALTLHTLCPTPGGHTSRPPKKQIAYQVR